VQGSCRCSSSTRNRRPTPSKILTLSQGTASFTGSSQVVYYGSVTFNMPSYWSACRWGRRPRQNDADFDLIVTQSLDGIDAQGADGGGNSRKCSNESESASHDYKIHRIGWTNLRH